MQIVQSRGVAYTVLRPVGTLSVTTAPVVRRALGKALADGLPVLVDLRGLSVGEPGAVAVFARALHAAGGWPGAALVLFGPDAPTERLLSAASVPASVPVVGGLAAALDRADHRPEVVRRSVPLGGGEAAVDTARSAVREVCGAWGLRPTCRESAVVVTAELVANAVVHAGGPRSLGVEHNGRRLWLRVRDGSTTVPRRRPAALDGVGTHGIDVVEHVAAGWGVTPYPGGKTVWAWLPATVTAPAT
jgi:anti-anti-sigma regulatory factor